MKTIEIQLYKFEELSEEVKKKVVERLMDINIDYDWWDSIYEDAGNIGLKISSFDIYEKQIEGSFAGCNNGLDVAFLIKENHGENCEMYNTAIKFIDKYNEMFNKYEDKNKKGYILDGKEQEFDDELRDMENDFLKAILEDYLVLLETEVEYRESDEAIIETIEANDYDFTVNGEIF